MEYSRELLESGVHPLGEALESLTGSKWFWVEAHEEDYSERGTAIMVEDEASIEVPVASSYLILPEQGTDCSVAMGAAADALTLNEQMSELEDLLREFGRNCDPDISRQHYRAQKAMYRCVDVLRGFNNG